MVKISSSCLLFLFHHLFGFRWCCPASIETKRMVPEECYSARAFSRAWALGLSPQLASAHSQSALQWNLFMPLRKKLNLKACLLLFFLPWLHHKREQEQWRHWVVASPRLRCTAETHSIIKRACRLWSDLLKMTHIVNIAFPAASR